MPKLKIILQFNKFWLLLILMLSIYVYFVTQIIKYDSVYDLSVSNITGKIMAFSINGNKLSLDIKAKENIKATYYFKTEEEKNNYAASLCLGCTIYLNGEFSVPLNNTIPNTFNYRKYLYNKKIYRLLSIANLKIIKPNNNLFFQIKNYFYKQVEKQENKDYLKIFILGDKSLISSEEYKAFQNNGVAHLLAISGMHIGVFLKILDVIFNKVKAKKKVFIIASVLLFYAYLTNFAASIMRAVIFYIFLNLKKILHLKISNFKVLILTASFLLIINPFFIYDVGFLYSFVITGGLILNNKLIKGNYFKQLLIISILSFLFSLPITVNLNYEINLTSILANLVFVPYISLIVYPASLITFLCPYFGSIYNFLITILNTLNFATQKLALFIIIPKMHYLVIFIYYFLLLISFKKKKVFLALVSLIIIVKIMPKLDNHFYVYYLDVGQGDSSVLISPYQKEVLMIDTGGKMEYEKEDWAKSSKSYYLSDNTLLFLKSLGITKINYLFLSHGDNDHAGEAIHIINNFKVQNLVLNNDSFNDLEKEILKYKSNTSKVNLKYFQLVNLNNKLYDNENDNSLVLYLKINKFGLLYMGDAGKIVEEDIIRKYQMPVTFLKLGHHGSNTSSSEEFIKNLKFDYGIISSGRNNIYNHPSQETLATLNKYQRKYFNTQTSGTIAIQFSQNAYNIITYLP